MKGGFRGIRRWSAATWLLVVPTASWGGAAGAAGENPPVPIGIDRGRIVFSLFGPGINYTRPELANRLARDGEGLIIGFDQVDGDLQPYPDDPGATSADAVALAVLLANAEASVAPYRIRPGDLDGFGAMLGHAGQNPGRLLIVTRALAEGLGRETLLLAAQSLPNVIVVAPAVESRPEVIPEAARRAIEQSPPANIVLIDERIGGADEAVGTRAPADRHGEVVIAFGAGGPQFDGRGLAAVGAYLIEQLAHEPTLAASEAIERLLRLGARAPVSSGWSIFGIGQDEAKDGGRVVIDAEALRQ
ncbi:MAG: hypothetical protein GC150_10605 [Rhizobiales bacterium]|nr:hypothetical protein [Hyphomicrobiales bacterium]